MQEFTDVRSVLIKGTRMYVSVDSSSEVMRSALKAVGLEEIAIAVPFKDGHFYPLKQGTCIEVFFYQGSGRYYFKSEVNGRIIFEGRPVLKCKLPRKMILTERRDYYRVDTLFPIELEITKNAGEARNSQKYKGQCTDISGGGFQLSPTCSVSIPLKLGMIVIADFHGYINGISKISGIAIREPESYKRGWGIKFTSITEADRNKIVKYVFKKQLEKKQWENEDGNLSF